MDEPPFPAVALQSEDQLAALLVARRQALALSADDLDDRAGFMDTSCLKLESPTGRRFLWGFTDFATYWLEALGLRLVLVDAATADALVSAATAPALEGAEPRARSGFEGKRPAVRRVSVRTRVTWTRAA